VRHSTLFLLFASLLPAAEGKWTPDQVLQVNRAWLRQQGLALPASRIWDGRGGLLSAVINIGGCSASFISPEGLFITNHHCLFAIVQEHSSTAKDLITTGFLARSRPEELASKSTRITIPSGFRDVTAEVKAAIPDSADDLARYRAVDRKTKSLVAGCEESPGHRCQVAAFDGGVRYVLVDALEIADVRLVYAPPRSVGEFGGEIDNFAWPRHTGDFAIGRAYVNGVPYRNAAYLPVSRGGVKPGDFVMVMGYPGVTYRSFTAAEMEARRDLFFASRVDLLGEWIRVLETATANDPGGRIAVAANLKSMDNAYKNAEGQLEGIRRGRLLEKQRTAEQDVVRWAMPRSKYSHALAARAELERIASDQRRYGTRDFLLSNIANGPKALYFAATLVRIAIERQKPDAEREAAFQERQLPRLRDRLEREQKNYFRPADEALFASFAHRAGGAGLTATFPESLPGIAALYSGTRVLDLDERLKMFAETVEQLHARRDPALEIGLAIERDRDEMKERHERWDGAISRLRPAWREAVIAYAGKPAAPDANGTLRVSFAHVSGYQPRDAVLYQPQTTLSGMLEKYTGKDPFDAPAALLQAAKERAFGPWQDRTLKDIPVDFLSDADTTGGNSGSPTVNGRGELAGVNFDRVWENVANDFGYNPAVARNINADIRYLLWILDRVEHADTLLRELGVASTSHGTR
jgi:hypothetical protein